MEQGKRAPHLSHEHRPPPPLVPPLYVFISKDVHHLILRLSRASSRTLHRRRSSLRTRSRWGGDGGRGDGTGRPGQEGGRRGTAARDPDARSSPRGPAAPPPPPGSRGALAAHAHWPPGRRRADAGRQLRPPARFPPRPARARQDSPGHRRWQLGVSPPAPPARRGGHAAPPDAQSPGPQRASSAAGGGPPGAAPSDAPAPSQPHPARAICRPWNRARPGAQDLGASPAAPQVRRAHRWARPRSPPLVLGDAPGPGAGPRMEEGLGEKPGEGRVRRGAVP